MERPRVSEVVLKASALVAGVSTLANACGGESNEPIPSHTNTSATYTLTVDSPSKINSDPSITVVPEPTPNPTETQAPEPEILGNGLYNSIQEMQITESQKATIEKLLGVSTPMIIGKQSILAVKNTLMQENVIYNEVGELEPSPQIKEIKANTKKYPDAIEKQDIAALQGLFFAWQLANPGSDLTFEQYQASGDPMSSSIRALNQDYEGPINQEFFDNGYLASVPFDKNAVVVWDVIDTPEGAQYHTRNGAYVKVVAENNVVYIGIYKHDIAGLDFNNPNRKFHEVADNVAFSTGVLNDPALQEAGPTMYPVNQFDLGEKSPVILAFKQVQEGLTNIAEGGNESIYNVVGVSARTGETINTEKMAE